MGKANKTFYVIIYYYIQYEYYFNLSYQQTIAGKLQDKYKHL